jgi:hypothetical protein
MLKIVFEEIYLRIYIEDRIILLKIEVALKRAVFLIFLSFGWFLGNSKVFHHIMQDLRRWEGLGFIGIQGKRVKLGLGSVD